MFRNFIEKEKLILIEENSYNKIFSTSTMFFSKNLFITIVLQNNILHKLHSHVHYEKAYQHKKFQKFNIKTLILGSDCDYSLKNL